MILILYVLQQEFLREKSFIKNRPDFDNKKTHLNYITLNRRTYSSSVWAGTRAHTRPRAHTRALPHAPCPLICPVVGPASPPPHHVVAADVIGKRKLIRIVYDHIRTPHPKSYMNICSYMMIIYEHVRI